ncbi:MAG: hypothetical protein LPH21_11250 [Shewanella sp.]|nr:hypothetical protein [Shewanella sp.]MCF1458095.1 hypothetical protein [Shewanella sp.]
MDTSVDKEGANKPSACSASEDSPWQDHHTAMLLAKTSVNIEGDLLLGFGRYIYLHRDSQGKQLGISISKAMLADTPELESQYLFWL